jgi:hypothetical protein
VLLNIQGTCHLTQYLLRGCVRKYCNRCIQPGTC